MINNAIYPKPSWANNAAVAGQKLTVTNGAVVQFAAFDGTTSAVVLDIQVANVYCTFDGTTPSATRGHILYATQSYTWSTAAATAAKFLATTATDAIIFASEFQI